MKTFLKLIKVKITVAVAISTVLGYVVAAGEFNSGIILPVLGLFILACGSAALNQYQERDLDAKMERTSERPIPSGKISARNALIISITLITTGSILLYIGSNFLALQLALLTLIWYNAVYTPLKRKTAFAIIPGALIGALPPLVGYSAVTGTIANAPILYIAFFYFIWQIPHFWLLFLMHHEEYEAAGFPSIAKLFGKKQLAQITFLWTTATAVSIMMFPIFQVVSSLAITILLFSAAIGLIVLFSGLLFNRELKVKRLFIFINIFLILVNTLIIIDVV
jgi:protoheme IX farnesyltransferase